MRWLVLCLFISDRIGKKLHHLDKLQLQQICWLCMCVCVHVYFVMFRIANIAHVHFKNIYLLPVSFHGVILFIALACFLCESICVRTLPKNAAPKIAYNPRLKIWRRGETLAQNYNKPLTKPGSAKKKQHGISNSYHFICYEKRP